MGSFIAHLHPLLVHLPIGFIAISFLIEWYLKKSNFSPKDELSIYLWSLNAIVSILAMATGLAALRMGYYEGVSLFFHMLCGCFTTLVCALIWFVKWKNLSIINNQIILLKVMLAIGIILAGNFGGILTHGEEHLPLAFNPRSELKRIDLRGRDSINFYTDVIKVIFDNKCNRCHNNKDARSRLVMTTEEGLLSNQYGKSGISPNSPMNSEIFNRISLSPWHQNYMPPSGLPITYKEIKMIEWWIMQGAPFTGTLYDLEIDKEMKTMLNYEYGIEIALKPYFTKSLIEPLSKDKIEAIIEEGFNVRQIATNSNFLDVSNHGQSRMITQDRINTLVGAGDHIAWLNISHTDLNDEGLWVLSKLSNLTKLNINNTNITDIGVDAIAGFERLTMLNIYGTNISDIGLEKLSHLKKLEALYLWQTKTTATGIEKLKASLPNCRIERGI